MGTEKYYEIVIKNSGLVKGQKRLSQDAQRRGGEFRGDERVRFL
jgi:hypothetical protein